MSRSKWELAIDVLEASYQVMMRHLGNITLDEDFFIRTGGYRSVLGTLKHATSWSHVYRSMRSMRTQNIGKILIGPMG
jgi:hypothetical protein